MHWGTHGKSGATGAQKGWIADYDIRAETRQRTEQRICVLCKLRVWSLEMVVRRLILDDCGDTIPRIDHVRLCRNDLVMILEDSCDCLQGVPYSGIFNGPSIKS